MSNTPKLPPAFLPTVAEDKVITTAAKRDPDALPLTREQLRSMIPMAVLRERRTSENQITTPGSSA